MDWKLARKVVAGVLVALAAMLTPVAVLAVWTETTVTDPEPYLEIVAGLSSDPEVQDVVRQRIVGAVVERIDPGRLTARLVETAVTRAVDRVFGSERFGEFWMELNRAAHAEVTGVLRGEGATVVLAPDGTLGLRLGPILDAVAGQLAEAGIPVPVDVSTTETVDLVTSPELVQVQTAHDLLAAAAAWLPWVCIVALVTGVLLAPRRAQAVMVGGVVTAAVTVLLAITLHVVADGLEGLVAEKVSASLLASLLPWLWWTIGVAAAVAVGAWGLGMVATGRSERADGAGIRGSGTRSV